MVGRREKFTKGSPCASESGGGPGSLDDRGGGARGLYQNVPEMEIQKDAYGRRFAESLISLRRKPSVADAITKGNAVITEKRQCQVARHHMLAATNISQIEFALINEMEPLWRPKFMNPLSLLSIYLINPTQF